MSLVLLPIAALVIGGLLGVWLGRAARWRMVIGILVAGAALAAWLFWSGPRMPGIDGLGRVYLAMLAVIPFEIGILLTAGVIAARYRGPANDG